MNEVLTMHEKGVDNWMEQARELLCNTLKSYLDLYRRYDRLKVDIRIREEKPGKRFYSDDLSFYQEDGKINWEVIRKCIHYDMEQYLKREYPMLNENEVRLCCLLFFKIPVKTIAKILPYKEQSIRSVAFKIKQKAELGHINEMFRKIIVNKA